MVSQGRVIEGGVVSVVPSLPDGVASACVGLLRLKDRFSQDVQGLDAGTIDNIGSMLSMVPASRPWTCMSWRSPTTTQPNDTGSFIITV